MLVPVVVEVSGACATSLTSKVVLDVESCTTGEVADLRHKIVIMSMSWRGTGPVDMVLFDCCRRISQAGLSLQNDFAKSCVSSRHPRDLRQNNVKEKTLEGQHECGCQNRCQEHFPRRHDVFVCVSRRLGAQLERMSSACVCACF